jgi:hypothetical protein
MQIERAPFCVFGKIQAKADGADLVGTVGGDLKLST